MKPEDLLNDPLLMKKHVYSCEDLGEFVTRLFPTVRERLSKFLNFFDTSTPGVMQLNKHQVNFLKLMQGHSYGDIMSVKLHQPQGLKSTFVEYATVLQKCAPVACIETPQLLSEYAKYIAGLVSSNAAMVESVPLNQQHAASEKLREGLIDEMAACFGKDSTDAMVPTKQVIKRNNDWEAVLTMADSLSVELNKVDRASLNKQVKETVEMMDLLGKRVHNDELKDVSPEVLIHLANGAYQIGKALEFFSVVYYRVSVFNRCVNDDLKLLTEMLEERTA